MLFCASIHAMTVMNGIEGIVLSAADKNAVVQTFLQVNETMIDLCLERDKINRRIRSLRRLIRGLRNLAGKGADNRRSSEEFSHRLTFGTEDHDFTDEQSGPALCSLASCSQKSGSLRRACRIAIFEAGGVASLEDIYSRIVRRGSFTFPNPTFARAELLKILHAMVHAKEICRIDHGLQISWSNLDVSPIQSSVRSAKDDTLEALE
jgi:hypothetical protein